MTDFVRVYPYTRVDDPSFVQIKPLSEFLLLFRLHYVRESLPKSEEDWNKCQFVDKTHWGYYTWPQ